MLCFLLLYADLSGPLAFERQTAWRQTNPEAIALVAGEMKARDYLDILASHSKSTLGGDASELDAINKVMPQGLKVTRHSRLKEGWLFTCNKFHVFLSCANKMWWEISEELGQGVATLIRCYESRMTLLPFVSVPAVKEMQENDTIVVPQQLESSQPVVLKSSFSGKIPVESMGNTSEEEESEAAQEFQKAKEIARQAEEKLEKKKEARFISMLEARQQQRYQLITAEMEARAGNRGEEETGWNKLQFEALSDLLRMRNDLFLQDAKEKAEQERVRQHKDIAEFSEQKAQELERKKKEVEDLQIRNQQEARERDTQRQQELERQRQADRVIYEQERQELVSLQRSIDEVCGGMTYVQKVTEEAERAVQSAVQEKIKIEELISQLLHDNQRLQDQLAAASKGKEELRVRLLEEKEVAVKDVQDRARGIITSRQQKDQKIREQADIILSIESELQHTREQAGMVSSLLEMCTSSRLVVQQYVSGLVQRINTGELKRLTDEDLSQLKVVLLAFNAPSANSTPDSVFQNIVEQQPPVHFSVHSSPEQDDTVLKDTNTVNQFVLV